MCRIRRDLGVEARRFEAEGLVTKYEFWEFLRAVIDDGGSIAVSARSCIRWFWNMSRTTPASS